MKQVEEALALMKEKGFKNTPKRQAMLEVIAEEGKFISARQVQEALSQQFSGLSYDTVYRNLYTFVEQGILEMSERHGEKVFVMHCHDHKHHHHFVCDDCGKITEIEFCPMDLFVSQLPDYLILGHQFEINGLCPDCLKKKSQEEVHDLQEHHDHDACHCGFH